MQYFLFKKNKLKSNKGRTIFIDTSALMDGRIVTITRLGFVAGTLIIPRSVVLEMQLLADKADSDKRMRARAGLDAVAQLQQLEGVDVEILDVTSREGVDNHLLELAKRYKGKICTIDYNLNKVATAEQISVINPNDLAKHIRMAFLPGEVVSLEVVQKGQDSHQGIGYLTDGTMVVIEQAAKKIGETVEVEFTRALQTAAGRMMFAKLVSKPKSTSKRTGSRSSGRKSTAKHHRISSEDRVVELANGS